MNAQTTAQATEVAYPSLSPAGVAAGGSCRVLFEQHIRLDSTLHLDCGVRLTGVRVGVRMLGPAHAPVVAALGGISASRRVLAGDNERGQGWWQRVLGREGVDASRRYRVLGIDWLGGAEDDRLQQDFPPVSTLDQARVLAGVLDHLRIDRLHSVVSASYGGMVAQHFAAEYPQRLDRLMVIACAHEPEPMAVARRLVQRQILELTADRPAAGVALARALAMTTYRSADEFRARFSGPGGQARLTSYLDHQGRRFAERFDAGSYRRLMDAIDNHRLDPQRLQKPLSLLGFSTDELCPPALLQSFAAQVPGPVELEIIDSRYGHDAFLCEQAAVACAIDRFLQGDAA
jgi:homoserine O-acetyltransferase